MSLPEVVIIGRPNVGKSTIFNRLVGRRRAVTHSVSGVTRDPIEEETSIEGHSYFLIDTGGFTKEREEILRKVAEKALKYLDRAVLILFVVEVSGYTAADEELIDVLRPYGDKLIVIANKADNARLEQDSGDLFSAGFENLLPISAIHNRNIDILKGLIVKFIQTRESDRESGASERPGLVISILGKPNTGKSTLLNTLLSDDRSIVSDVPGTTRDIIIGSFWYRNTMLQIMDTAGIRRKKKVTEDLEYYSVNRALGSIRHAHVVLLLIDAQEGLTEQDKKIAAQIVKKGKGIIFVVNKWDTTEKIPNAEHAFSDRIVFLFPILAFAPIVFISALYKQGIDKLLNTIMKVWRELNRQVQTSKLNKHFTEWIQALEPPRKNNFRWKAKYILQSGTNPVQFILFVNRKSGFPEAYIQYIKNKIRTDFGFKNIPIQLDLRE